MFFTLLIIINQLVFYIDFKDESVSIPKMDNLTIKDEMPAPKLSVIGKSTVVHYVVIVHPFSYLLSSFI